MSSLHDLPDDFSQCMVADRHRLNTLRATIKQRRKQNKPADKSIEQFDALFDASKLRYQQRLASVPAITFPDDLPISQRRDDIAAAIRDHQVVILAGETGSGKTTQLPKICLELGRGVAGMIGHTQPRRIAARTVANRIAEELKVNLGEAVGYQVRFTDHSSDKTHVKLMTDGILLAEIQQDRFLNRFDTIIIDEAHERSLNIDFLLGYLKQLLPRRPDLKVIITSATIDVERLSAHFDNAPVVEVSGRTYPVDIIYRPSLDSDDDLITSIVTIVEEIAAGMHGNLSSGAGDVLVFLSGERDIRETALALRKANLPHIDILPLYARLSLAEQNKVFQPHKGMRVVLATNVAETSITVPGIRYVIDPGFARVSRYSYRTKVQRLPIEPISQASANQRAGRSGRVAEGVCFRLYEAADFAARPEFNDPEILRSNLASVILQMTQLRIGDVRHFPFVDQPDTRLINDGYKLLEELHALGANEQLTPLGKQLSNLPVDPRLARMCIAANTFGCLREVLIIVSALTVQDPRERPAEKRQAADEKHRRFWEEGSDFLAYLKLWDYIEEQRQALSQNQLKNQCKKEFLSFLRLREWRDLHHQLRLACKHLNLKENREPSNYEAIHRALLTGLLGNIGLLTEEKTYLGPRNRKFSIFPGSSLFKKLPKWVTAAELIETTKLYAHCAAKIDPDWLLTAADHLVKRHYFEPHYDSSRGQVMAFERVTLYGLVLVEKRSINYSAIDAAAARAVFIQAALVEGKYKPEKRQLHGQKGASTEEFWQYNQALYQELEELEAKSRRRDILAEDHLVFEFFDQRVPATVVNRKSFDHWRKKAEQETPDLLRIPRDLLMQHAAVDITEAQFPNELEFSGKTYRISYCFEPGSESDGVNLHVPVHALHIITPQALEWLVPGLLRDKCVQLVKALPKQWRKHFVPVPEYVDKAMPLLNKNTGSLTESLSAALMKLTSVQIPAELWQSITVEPFYQFNLCIENDAGKIIDKGRDIQQLRAKYRERLQDTLRSVGESHERSGIVQWDFGDLATTEHLKRKGVDTLAYPALVDAGEHVDLRLFDSPLQAQLMHERGVARLLLIELGQAVKYLRKNILQGKNVGLRLVTFGKADVLIDDLLLAAVKQTALASGAAPRSEADFVSCLQIAKQQLTARANALEKLVLDAADKTLEIQTALRDRNNKPLFAAIETDINEQLAQLKRPNFLYYTDAQWLDQYPRYFEGIKVRLQKADAQIQKDLANTAVLAPLQARLADYWQADNENLLLICPEVRLYRWMLEELRVSLFAQPMKTRFPISEKRLDKQWEKAQKELAELSRT